MRHNANPAGGIGKPDQDALARIVGAAVSDGCADIGRHGDTPGGQPLVGVQVAQHVVMRVGAGVDQLLRDPQASLLQEATRWELGDIALALQQSLARLASFRPPSPNPDLLARWDHAIDNWPQGTPTGILRHSLLRLSFLLAAATGVVQGEAAPPKGARPTMTQHGIASLALDSLIPAGQRLTTVASVLPWTTLEPATSPPAMPPPAAWPGISLHASQRAVVELRALVSDRQPRGSLPPGIGPADLRPVLRGMERGIAGLRARKVTSVPLDPPDFRQGITQQPFVHVWALMLGAMAAADLAKLPSGIVQPFKDALKSMGDTVSAARQGVATPG